MSQAAAATTDRDPQARALYDKLEDRILARDQRGASDVYYDLVRQGRPLDEMLREAVRIHGPYTHVPYHERIDKGFVNFVNNDHCLLSARATLHLSKWLPQSMAGLPMAQTVWYIPTGLDIWNQKINKAPGHYSRGMKPTGAPVPPVVHWPDQDAEHIEGPLEDKLEAWMTLVHRGRVLEAYRVFLGLMEDKANRRDGTGAAGVCRADRRAGPRVPQPLVHHRPQVVSRAGNRGARHRHRLGQRQARPVCGSARHGGRPALVLDLRDGLQLRDALPRAAEDLGHSLCRNDGARARAAAQRRAPVARRGRGLPRGPAPAARAGLPRGHEQAAAGRQGAAPHPRHPPDRRRPGAAGDAGPAELLDLAALLRILQHAWLVLRHLRASAAAEAAVRRGLVPQPERLPSTLHRRSAWR